jgi:hypothetical protein
MYYLFTVTLIATQRRKAKWQQSLKTKPADAAPEPVSSVTTKSTVTVATAAKGRV